MAVKNQIKGEEIYFYFMQQEQEYFCGPDSGNDDCNTSDYGTGCAYRVLTESAINY